MCITNIFSMNFLFTFDLINFLLITLVLKSAHGVVIFGSHEVTLGMNILNSTTKSTIHEVLQEKYIKLPFDRPGLMTGELINFELFDNVVVVGKISNVYHRGSEGISWSGDLITDNSDSADFDDTNGNFVLTCVDSSCIAHLYVESPLSEYSIGPAPTSTTQENDDLHVLTQFSIPREKMSATSKIVDNFMKAELFNNSFPQNDDHMLKIHEDVANYDADDILDILVLYTPQALAAKASFPHSLTGLKSAIHSANDESNGILKKSGVSLRFRIVGIESAGDNVVEPTGMGAFGASLGWITNPKDGHIDIASVYKKKYGADAVVLIISAYAYCGVAWINTGYSSGLSYAVYSVHCLYGYIWTHELGHTLGCYHDRISTKAKITNTYFGYGHCWEKAVQGPKDCFCRQSIMVASCRTQPRGCTSCTLRSYLANYKIYDSGNPTGTELASCGLLIDQRSYKAVKYVKSVQPGGIFDNLYPRFALNTSCEIITINGWRFSLTGSDIVSVTLVGVPTTIISQTMDSVTVITPQVANPTGIYGDVVITTATGRSTTGESAFKFDPAVAYYIESFPHQTLVGSMWINTGNFPWDYYSDLVGNIRLTKAPNSNLDATVSELTLYSNYYGCINSYSKFSMLYSAYSTRPSCYGEFTISYRFSDTGPWIVIWRATDLGYLSGYYTYSTDLPNGTVGVRIRSVTVKRSACLDYAKLKLDDLTVLKTTVCNTTCPPPVPSMQPSSIPTKVPTKKPVKPPTSYPTIKLTKGPTGKPVKRPTSKPTKKPIKMPTEMPLNPPTSKPTKKPTEEPTEMPLKPPTRHPTIKPSKEPTGKPKKYQSNSPTRFPTDIFLKSPSKLTVESSMPTGVPTAVPTLLLVDTPTGVPTAVLTLPIVDTPTEIPTAAPSTLLIVDTPTEIPTAAPSTLLIVDTPTEIPTAAPSTLLLVDTPTEIPTAAPSTLLIVDTPTEIPTTAPSTLLIVDTPTEIPTTAPTLDASALPTDAQASVDPTLSPSSIPSKPTLFPTQQPSYHPSTSAPVIISLFYSVSPNYALNTTCQVITISGYRFSLTGSDIVSVTLVGVPTTIISQTMDSVTVITPQVANPTGIYGDVVITTATGRSTTGSSAFLFKSYISYSLDTFSSKSLSGSLWTNTGNLPWTYYTDSSGQIRLWKNGVSYSEYKVAEIQFSSTTVTDCVNTYSYISLLYWAYSTDLACYGPFTVSYRRAVTDGWTVLWTASQYGTTGYRTMAMDIPAGAVGLRIRIETTIKTNCRYNSQVKLDNIYVRIMTTCPSGCLPPTVTPTIVPNFDRKV